MDNNFKPKCYEDNCSNPLNSIYFRNPLPQCPENWNFVKRKGDCNICSAPQNYIGVCPKQIKFYNKNIGGQATGITTSYADYYTQKCGLNWGDRKFASPSSYYQPSKPEIIQNSLNYNPNVDNVEILKKMNIMNNMIKENFNQSPSPFNTNTDLAEFPPKPEITNPDNSVLNNIKINKIPIMMPYTEQYGDNENIDLSSLYSPIKLNLNIGYNNK